MSSNPTWVAVEKCQVCDKTTRNFTCRNCIKEGNFFNRKDTDNNKENSFASKKRRLSVVRNVNTDYEGRVECALAKVEKYAKNSELILLKSRIESLKLVIKETKERNAAEKVKNEELSSKLSKRKKKYDNLKGMKEELKGDKHDLHRKKINKEQLEERLRRRRSQLKQLQVSHVYALVKYIFPISERKLFPEFGTPPRTISTDNEAENNDVVSEVMSAAELELEEATRIIHVDGQWISQDTDETEHTIVEVGMPASGDFMKYYEWLKSYRNEPRKHESHSGLHSNAVLNIPASLVYTTQLTDGLSFFLGVCLPNRVEYYDFSIFRVSRKRLFDTVNRLSQNVMRLCFSQLVPASLLNPNQMLRNIQLLVSISTLGWWGSFNTEEYRLAESMFDSDSSAEEINDSDYEDQPSMDQEEWDKLLDMPPDHSDIQSVTPMSSLESGRERSLSSSATDLVSSAAASFSSLWSWKR